MYATIHKIPDIEAKFAALENEKENADQFTITDIGRAPSSGQASDVIAHHQGAFQCDGSGNYIISGSVKEDWPYFYIIKDWKGAHCCTKEKYDYFQIPNLAMTHPGGIQAAENILAIGMEQYSGGTTRKDRSDVMFFNISDEENIVEITQWRIPRVGDGEIASAIGLSKRKNQWILAVRGQKNIAFYTNDGKDGSAFLPCGSLEINKKEYNGQKIENDDRLKEFQQMFLYMNDNEEFYLIGMPDGSSTTDKCWLHKLHYETGSDGHITRFLDIPDCRRMIHFKRKGDGPRFMYAASVWYNLDKAAFLVTSMEGHVINGQIRCNRWYKR